MRFGRSVSYAFLLVVFSIAIVMSFPARSFATSLSVGCYAEPGACGYPDPNHGNVGAGDCSSLPAFSFSDLPPGTYWSGIGNLLEITSDNVTISNMNMGDITIYISDVNNFTLDNVCINHNGAGDLGSDIINIPGGVTGTTIENSTLSGTNDTTGSVGSIINNNGSGTTISGNYMYNNGNAVQGGGSSTIGDNYELLNATIPGDHYEPVYCSDSTLSISHNTFLNKHDQTAEVFCDTGGGAGGACDNHLTITNNLMAGGGYVIYPCGNASSVGTSTSDIENNRFARCLGTPVTAQTGGGYTCGTTDLAGADSHGYWPHGGYYSVAAYYYTGAGQTWSGNYWDDNLDEVNIDGTAGAPVADGAPICTTSGGRQICSLASGNAISSSLTVPSDETLTVDGTACDVTVQSGGILKGTGSVCDLTTDNGGIVAPGHSPGTLTVNGNFNGAGTYQVEIQSPGTTAGTDYDQIVVTGNVTLSGGSLSTSLLSGFTPSVGQSFKIIDNQGSNTVTGSFSGLAEGAVFAVGSSKFQITYKGGDGNDVVLTTVSPSTPVTAAPGAGVAPGTPDTGFGALSSNPLPVILVTIGATATLLMIARRLSPRPYYTAR